MDKLGSNRLGGVVDFLIIKMKILFIHQNFPGQFKHLAPALKAAGHEVVALGMREPVLNGFLTLRHNPTRRGTPGLHPWLQELEAKFLRGHSALQVMLALRQKGWHPDRVIAHPGWGEALFVKEVWPNTRLLCFLEFFYQARGLDVGFDPEFGAPSLDLLARLPFKNTNQLLALQAMDCGLSPTRWQRSTYPKVWQPKIEVVFDGIDTQRVAPDPDAVLSLRDLDGRGVDVRQGDEVLTFVARHLEPYRGYHQFMRALPSILRQRPQARVLIVGGDGLSYGAPAPGKKSWKSIFLEEVQEDLDLSRVHFLGQLAYAQYLKVLQVSRCHVYLTYPFVLSWSCVEALACGCALVASSTPPVQEVIEHEHNGLLVDFFSPQALSESCIKVLSQPQLFHAMRERARAEAVARYDLQRVCLPAQMALVTQDGYD